MLFFSKKTPEVKLINNLNHPHKGDKFSKLVNDNLVIDLRKVYKSYCDSSSFISNIIKGVDLQIYEGEFVVILGPSGSGKTTLMNIMSGLDRATSGYVNILGSNLICMNDDELTNFRRINIGYIFQQYGLIPNLNAKENVGIGKYLNEKNDKDIKRSYKKESEFVDEYFKRLQTKFLEMKLDEQDIFLSNMNFVDYLQFVYINYYKNDLDTISKFILTSDIVERYNYSLYNYCQEWKQQIQYRFDKEIVKSKNDDIDTIMSNLGIDHLAKKYPNEMSGGQQQRISIARSFAKNPAILFADEPTGAVDLKMNDIILNNFKEINKKYQTTVIIVTHNPDIAKLATKVVHFSDGKIKKIVEQVPQDTI